jgi:adenylate kinase
MSWRSAAQALIADTIEPTARALRARYARPPNFVFLGPPGVGKGTYSKLLAAPLGCRQVEAGSLVRESPKWRHASESGQLIPGEAVSELLRPAVRDAHADGVGVLLDGFPRSIEQAQLLPALLGRPPDAVVHLTLRRDALLAKCVGRRVCARCGAAYNVADVDLANAAASGPAVWLPALQAPGCGPDGTCVPSLRADDAEATVLARLDAHDAQVAPLLELYEREGRLVNFAITAGVPGTLRPLFDASAAGLTGRGIVDGD